jgi:predicted RNA-binding protein with TRAM domain
MFILVLTINSDCSMSSDAADGGQDSGTRAAADDSQSKQPSPKLFKEKPVKVGEEMDVTVSEISRRGEGVARVQGFVIFIPTAKQGTQAKIRIKEIRPNFATAELIEGSAPSS